VAAQLGQLAKLTKLAFLELAELAERAGEKSAQFLRVELVVSERKWRAKTAAKLRLCLGPLAVQ